MTDRSRCGVVRVLALLAAAVLTWAAAAVPAQAAGDDAAAGIPADPPEIDARAVVLIDAGSGRVLHARSAQTPVPMASTTKIMTAWLLAEMAAPDATLWIPIEARGIPGSKLYLEPGERYTARDLLLALMVASANDAAVAVAVNLAGSVEDFAALMNRRAEELGLHQTRFANPHGLDAEGHHASALDLALLARAAMTNPVFREAAATTEATIAHPIAASTRTIHSHNRFLVTYPGATGIKTGFTNGAGFSLVGGAERNGVELIGVILGGDSDVRVARAMARLMDWGFASFVPREVVAEGEPIVLASVEGAEGAEEDHAVNQTWIATESLVTLLPVGEDPAADLTWRLEGERLQVFYRGHPVGSVALRAEPANNQSPEETGASRRAGFLGAGGARDARLLSAVSAAALGVTLWLRRRRGARRRFSWQVRRDGWGPKP